MSAMNTFTGRIFDPLKMMKQDVCVEDIAHAGAGLWGDTRYNPVFTDKKGWFDLALFAWHLEFDHPVTKKHLAFKVPAGSQITAHFKAEECK